MKTDTPKRGIRTQEAPFKVFLCCVVMFALAFSLYSCEGERNFNEEPYTGEINIQLPVASGEIVYENYGVRFDVSNQAEGYFAASCAPREKRVKMRVLTPLGNMYDYDITDDGVYAFFPFSEGSGQYNVSMYEQREGSTYSVVYGIDLSVDMEDDKSCFVYPNQRVQYDAVAQAVYRSYQLTQGIQARAEIVDILFSYVATHLTYDNDFADRVRNGEVDGSYIPNPDMTLTTQKGVCYDYAVLLAAMLRAQDLEVRLVVGYVSINGETISHAWNAIWDGNGWVRYDATLYESDSQVSDYVELYYY